MSAVNNRKHSGFTLIEVVIALAVVAVALSAAITSASYYSRNSYALKERTLAHWVGQNVFAEMENSDPWPGTGERNGNSEMVGQRWHWTATIQQTPDPSLRRVDIEVALAENPDRVINRISGFLGETPLRPDPDQEPEGGMPP